jgi:hypothetical protein
MEVLFVGRASLHDPYRCERSAALSGERGRSRYEESFAVIWSRLSKQSCDQDSI